MNVFLVENCGNAPGRIEAVFAHAEDAEWFAGQLDDEAQVVERTLFYGQPSVRGYNE